MNGRAMLALAALCGSRIALAQPTPTPPAQPPPPQATLPTPGHVQDWAATTQEDWPDQNAATLYEEALRAETLGKKILALQLAQQALDASPNGRYSPAVGRLLHRLTAATLANEPVPGAEMLGSLPPPSASVPAYKGETPIGSRVAYVVSGGLIGGGAGALFGAAGQSVSGSEIAGLGLLGAVVGVGLTLATSFAVDDGSMPTHLWSWGVFGATVAGGAILLAQNSNPSGSLIAGLLGAGMLAGAVIGGVLGGVTTLTGGDGAAGLVLGSDLVGELALIETSYILGNNPDGNTAAQVVGGTMLGLALVGFIGGELLNHQIHWSGSRWGLIFLSTALGAGLAGLLAGITNSNASTVLGLLAGGDALGFAVGCVSTIGMSPDVSRQNAPAFSGEQGMRMPAIPRATFAWEF
jgi:hypothetical protein